MLLVTGSTAHGAVSFTRVPDSLAFSDGSLTRGACFVDYDGDGYEDLFFTNENAVDFLYHNNGDGTFTKVLAEPFASVNQSSDASAWGDYDNDGDLDCLVSTWKGQTDIFYENNGDGTFTQRTPGSLLTPPRYSDYAGWRDFDNDGDLDAYISVGFGTQLNQFYVNNGDKTFSEPVSGDVVTDVRRSHGMALGDYDNDGDQDIYVANVDGTNSLYQNQGDGLTWTPVTTGPHVTDLAFSIRSNFGDYDNDGDLDLFVTNQQSENNNLYNNDGSGNFTKVIGGDPVTDGGLSMSSAWADFDNDGNLDLLVTNGFGSVTEGNFLYFNNGDGTFAKEFLDPIVTDTGWSLGCSVSDVDHDGDLDVAIGKAYNSNENNALYLNAGNGNHFLSVRLTGGLSNRDGIGARVWVSATMGGIPIRQMREINSPTSFGQSGLVAWFGLGDAATVDTIRVEWPSGMETLLTGEASNQYLLVSECGTTDDDGDGIGDLCDACPGDTLNDPDADGVCGLVDNCGDTANPDQANADGDAFGDVCDLCPAVASDSNVAVVPGNVNADASTTSADIIHLVNFVFKGGTPPLPLPEAGDVNCDGNVTSADIIYLVNFVFKGGSAPCDVCSTF